MSRNESHNTKMNEIISQHSTNMDGSTNDLPPFILRSMSDASDFARRNPIIFNSGAQSLFQKFSDQIGNIRKIPTPSGMMSMKTVSCDIMSPNSSNNALSHNNNYLVFKTKKSAVNNIGEEDPDFDLNVVFDGIGALQNKGLNEPEDDNSTAPLQLDILSSETNQTESFSKALTKVETDGKVYNYDPEIYDEADIICSNEKYSLNARYLRDFRCDQCPLFLQHKCTQHKPFTCFHWHFANQRRRRPLRKRDGTFNYSPDIYCTKYDETTGICSDGDDCPFLHRTAGDTERRYHLRYYKTGMCVYETDGRGYCVKNGPHCAFAHGSIDLRMAVFDIREQTLIGDNECPDGLVNGHLFDKDRNALYEDPRWQSTAFVLAHYKTELCKRPPRLCRQGYACPQYHNNKDRRRSPKKFKYRSTPCPSVKQGDEWGDPVNCENQDECSYCHTRTEQQFHPEIYKSTKCNDIQQSGYCPRGPFCAFAHAESTEEINSAREFSMDPNSEIPPIHTKNNTSPIDLVRANSMSSYSRTALQTIASSLPEHFDVKNSPAPQSSLKMTHDISNISNNHNIGPIARPRSFSTSTTKTMNPLSLSNLRKDLNLNNQSNSMFFSATASASSLFSNIPQEPQQQPFNNLKNSFNMPPTFTISNKSNSAIDGILNHDLNTLDEIDGAQSISSSSNNDNLNVDVSSVLLMNQTEPINIPAHKDVRSVSAAGFNFSPPNKTNHLGKPKQQSSNGPLTFEHLNSMLSQANGSQQSTSLSNNQNLVIFIENRRLKEEISVLKAKLNESQDRFNQMIQVFQLEINEASKKEKLAEKTRDEALLMLSNSHNDILRNVEANSFQSKLNDLSALNRNQLLQHQQKLTLELKLIEEVI